MFIDNESLGAILPMRQNGKKQDSILYKSAPLEKASVSYDEDTDDLYIQLRAGASFKTVESGDTILLDYDEDNNLIGIEILNAKNLIKSGITKGADRHSLRHHA